MLIVPRGNERVENSYPVSRQNPNFLRKIYSGSLVTFACFPEHLRNCSAQNANNFNQNHQFTINGNSCVWSMFMAKRIALIIVLERNSHYNYLSMTLTEVKSINLQTGSEKLKYLLGVEGQWSIQQVFPPSNVVGKCLPSSAWKVAVNFSASLYDFLHILKIIFVRRMLTNEVMGEDRRINHWHALFSFETRLS